jgi:hypothetical protein
MKWINGETLESKTKRKKDWHVWFAWRPVIVKIINIDGKDRKVKIWLQDVLRRGSKKIYAGSYGLPHYCWEYEYKEITGDNLNKINEEEKTID